MEDLIALLQRHAGNRDSLCWVADGQGLVLGFEIGTPRYIVDFGREQVVEVGSTQRSSSYENAREPKLSIIPPEPHTGRQTGQFLLALEDKAFGATSQKQLLLVGLSEIERASPGALDKLSREKSRTKRVVSRDRSALNDDPKLLKFSQQIDGGWWVFTNNSFPETEKFIRRAAWHAGLHVRIEKIS